MLSIDTGSFRRTFDDAGWRASLAEDRLRELLMGGKPDFGVSASSPAPRLTHEAPQKLKAQLRAGTLDNQQVEVEVAETGDMPSQLVHSAGNGEP